MSRGKKDKEASLKWWASISDEKQKEISEEYFYSLSGTKNRLISHIIIELSETEIEIVWRRELKKN